MAVSFRQDPAATSAPSDPQSLNPATDPETGDYLFIVTGQSMAAGGGGLPAAPAIESNTFGGTWTQELTSLWAIRRRFNVFNNDDWSTPTGSLSVNFTSDQERAVGLVIVGGAVAWSAGPNFINSDGTDTTWTPTLVTTHDGYLVFIQMESETSIPVPPNDTWVKLFQVTAANGLRSLACFYHVGTISDATPTFDFGGFNGYSSVAYYFTADSGDTVPEAVDDLSGIAGVQEVVLDWTAPADGGDAITDYIVQFREV